MAYTRIHGIKTTLNKALDYIENPEKTEAQILVSGYNVDPLSASIEFRMTAALAREIKGDYTKTGGANNLAYHMIQSFAPCDKITPEEAHELGKKWADEVLKGKYEYVISSHVDKGHIHNHIIFNATSFYDYSKYDNYKVAGQLREVSDKLCAEQGLYVIEKPNLKNRSATHYEWAHQKAGTSWKAQIKQHIDEAINEAADYESFKAVLDKKGVEILEGARITFHIKGVTSSNGRAGKCRGDRIGEDYTKGRIIERLAETKKKMPPRLSAEQGTGQQGSARNGGAQPAFSSYDKKVEWQARETKLAATKELAAALMTIRQEGITGENDFDVRVDALSEKAKEARGTMKTLSEKSRQYKEAAKYLIAYKDYLPYKEAAAKQTVFTRKKYESRYESELRVFAHAEAQLEKLGVNTNVDVEKVIALVKDQDVKVSEISGSLKDIMSRLIAIRQAQQLVKEIHSAAPARDPQRTRRDIEI